MAAQSKKQSTVEQERPKKVVITREPEKDLFTWKAQARPFKKRNREFWVTVIAIAAISGLTLFFVEGFMPVILIISIVFLYYVLNTVEPGIIEYKITNRGIKVADKKTGWDILTRYWFTRRFNNELLVFEALILSGRLELVINPKDKGAIKKALSAYINEEEAPPSDLDKAANWFSKKLPQG